MATMNMAKIFILCAFILSFMIISVKCGDDPAVLPDTLPCVEKALPCQETVYSKNTKNPPAECCNAVSDLFHSDWRCLCGVYYNTDLLASVGVTQADLLQLPKSCGIPVDLSVCKRFNFNVTTDTTDKSSFRSSMILSSLPPSESPTGSTSSSPHKILPLPFILFALGWIFLATIRC